MQNKVNQVTFELAEARKEIAYKLPNTQLLSDQIDSLRKITQLQNNEIENLKVRIDTGESNVVNLNKHKTTIQAQAKEIKDLKASIAKHEESCKETSYEVKFQKLLVEYERLKRQKDGIQGNMISLHREYADYQDEREQSSEEKVNMIVKCEEEHAGIRDLVTARDEANKKYEDLRNTVTKNQPKKVSISKVNRRPKLSIVQQTPIIPQSLQQIPIINGPNKQQQSVMPQNNRNKKPIAKRSFNLQQKAAQQQSVQRQLVPQNQPVPQSQPIPQNQTIPSNQTIPQSMPQQSTSRQQAMFQKPVPQGNLQWETYVPPLPTPKKRKLSSQAENPQHQASPLPQQRIIPLQQMSPLLHQINTQQMSPHQQQMSPHSQQMSPYPQKMSAHPQQMSPHPQPMNQQPQKTGPSHPQKISPRPPQMGPHPQNGLQ